MAVPVSSVIGHSLEDLQHQACWIAWRRSARACTARWCRSRARRTTSWRWSSWSPPLGTGCSPRWMWPGRAHGAELSGVLPHIVRELGVVSDAVFAVASGTEVIEAVKTMWAASLTALPIVDDAVADAQILQDVSC